MGSGWLGCDRGIWEGRAAGRGSKQEEEMGCGCALSPSLVVSAVSVLHTQGQQGRYLPLLVFFRLLSVLAAVKIQQS